MAAYLKLSEDVKQLFECCICAGVFNEPRALPCLHTFCLKCLQDHGSHLGKNPGDMMPCSICRKEYLIPKEGFITLPKNFLIDKLVEGLCLSETEEKFSCDACKASNWDGSAQIQLATNYCPECQRYLCNQCTQEHAFESLSMNHKTIVLEFKPKTLDLSINESKVSHCHLHPEKQLDNYCHTCTLPICCLCVVENHRSHNCRTADKFVEEIQEVIVCEIEKVSQYIEEISTREVQLQNRKEEFFKDIEAKEAAIRSRGPRDDKTEHLLEELALTKHYRLKEMDTKKDEVDRHHVTLESFKALFTAASSSKETSIDVLIVKFKDILKQAGNLRQMHKSWILQQGSSSTIAHKTACWDKDTKACDAGNTGTAVVLHTSIRLVVQLKLPMSVTGVTKLLGEIYVLRHGSQSCSIRVFKDQSPFQLEKEISIEEVRLPQDIVASEESLCVYISDKGSKCIWKMTTTDCCMRKWLQDVDDPFTMSLSHDDHIVIPRCGQPTRLEVYSARAALIHRIQLALEIENIRHAVETPMRNFIILVQWTGRALSGVEQTSRWTVCEVNRDGHAVRFFEAADDSQQLNNPYYLSLDLHDGVLVVDYGSNTVVQFDSDLKWRQILLSMYKNSLLKPLRLSFDQNKRHLLVGQRGGTVAVYMV